MRDTSNHTFSFLLALCLLCTCTIAIALPDDATEPEYVDSVYEWGAWGLGIEPTSGNISARTADRAVNVKLADIKFRPNDNAAFRPTPTILPPTGRPPDPSEIDRYDDDID